MRPDEPIEEPVYDAPAPRRRGGHAGSTYLKPHRGGTILTLGICGILCVIPAIIAWVMATHDLREMREGRMDPSGQGLTSAGRILGIVFVSLFLVVFVLRMLVLFSRPLTA